MQQSSHPFYIAGVSVSVAPTHFLSIIRYQSFLENCLPYLYLRSSLSCLTEKKIWIKKGVSMVHCICDALTNIRRSIYLSPSLLSYLHNSSKLALAYGYLFQYLTHLFVNASDVLLPPVSTDYNELSHTYWHVLWCKFHLEVTTKTSLQSYLICVCKNHLHEICVVKIPAINV